MRPLILRQPDVPQVSRPRDDTELRAETSLPSRWASTCAAARTDVWLGSVVTDAEQRRVWMPFPRESAQSRCCATLSQSGAVRWRMQLRSVSSVPVRADFAGENRSRPSLGSFTTYEANRRDWAPCTAGSTYSATATSTRTPTWQTLTATRGRGGRSGANRSQGTIRRFHCETAMRIHHPALGERLD